MKNEMKIFEGHEVEGTEVKDNMNGLLAKMFKGHELEIIMLNDKPLFNANHVGTIIELKDTKSNIRNFKENEKIKVKNSMIRDIDFRKLNNAGENFLTEAGILKLLGMNQSSTSIKKETVIRKFQENGYLLDTQNLIITSRVEIEFLDALQQTLDVLGYSFKKQYHVDNYRIDAYIDKIKIAIEYDELKHESTVEKDIERQTYIENKLGCKFIRCSIRNTHCHNIGLVMKEIIKVKLKGEC